MSRTRLRRFSTLPLAAILLTGSLLHGNPQQKAESILRKTLQLYSLAEYYSCRATLSEEISFYNNRNFGQEFEPESIPINHSYQLEFKRPEQFDLSWSLVDRSENVFANGQLYKFDSLYILSLQYPNNPDRVEEPIQFTALNEAIDASEIASKRFASVLRDFLDPNFHEDLLNNELTYIGTRKLKKTKCHLIKVEGYKSMRIWIDQKNFALHQIQYTLSQEALLSESAWLEWKLSQAQLNLDPEEKRIRRRIDLYQTAQPPQPNTYTLRFDYQSLGP